MSSGLASDEVAEDYKNSLEDLKTNDRFQISNLTVIAKENTEHAMAISRVLENHIRTSPPASKLPALYVVDSVVKNVGTPYTLFLGRNLWSTFMEAYSVVDTQTRRKLLEMLKTWKEPVPGSLDTRPVFPVDITRNIDNALLKVKINALQKTRENTRAHQGIADQHRPSTQYWRATPTPQPYVAPPVSHPQPGPPTPEPHNQRQTGSSVDMASLHREIEQLIARARADLALQPLDQDINKRIKALTDLQTILLHQELPQAELMTIKRQIAQISATSNVPRASTLPVPPAPTATATPLVPPPVATPVPPVAVMPTPPPQAAVPNLTQQSLQALFNPGTLAELLRASTARGNPTPPPAAQPVPQPPPLAAPSMPQPASVAPQGLSGSLIASLRAKGLLPRLPGPPAPAQTPQLPLMVPGQTPSAASAPPFLSITTIDVPLNSSSVKTPRPNLIATLYEDKPDRCTTCGRRFTPDQEGKEKKAHHLDWHFKTNQRMTEALKRGQSRSWYLDEMDWIKASNFDDDSGMTVEYQNGPSAAETDVPDLRNLRKKPYLRAPNNPVLRNAPCPVCQENFESTWSEDTQDWIWQDAVKVGNRIYHSTCYQEISKEGGKVGHAGRGAPPRSETPESLLGKRKAEEEDNASASTKVKREPAD
ncbi:hypothetical protein KEM56_002615 [Ascosphaera pollenicola]|nr:hypothetical protein KEM56_002615 [Ascosphaera pollenicola]